MRNSIERAFQAALTDRFHFGQILVQKTNGDFCRSDGGCLRTILWKRDRGGTISSTKLPAEKFDPSHDQAAGPRSATPVTGGTIPLLCQEPCNLLVAECRKVVKMEGAAPSA